MLTLLFQGDELFSWRVFLVSKNHIQIGEMGLVIVLLIIDMTILQGLAMYLGFLKYVLDDCWLHKAGLQFFPDRNLLALI